MEISSNSSVRKISTNRPRPVSEKYENFIKSNRNSIKNLFKERTNLSLQQEEISFKFDHSTEILKTKSGLVMNSKKIEKEFEKLKVHDEKLHKKLLQLQNSKAKNSSQLKQKKLLSEKALQDKIKKHISHIVKVKPKVPVSKSSQSHVAVKSVDIGTAVNTRNINSNTVGVQTVTVDKVEVDVEENRVVEHVRTNSNDENFINSDINKDQEIVQWEEDKEGIQIQHLQDLEYSSSQESEEGGDGIQIKKEFITENCDISISQDILGSILEGREDFLCHGNYIKKFGMHRGSLEKFWDFLGLVSKQILEEILEIQLDYIVQLCDQFVDDIIKDELS